jgi:hypothetical protein
MRLFVRVTELEFCEGSGVMFDRMLAVAIVVFGLASMFAPDSASARSGGFAVGRAASFHGGFVHGGARLVVPINRGAMPAGIPVARAVAGAHDRRFVRPFRRFHHFFGADLPFAGIGVYGGWNDVPYDNVGAIEQPVYPAEEAPPDWMRPRPAARRTCSREDITVPSEQGGEHPVTIWRC